MQNLEILIVEDETLLAMELAESINHMGFHVVDYVTSCAMALEVVHTSKINLILMDINLGEELTGIELYKLFDTSVPVIYLSAYRDDETIAQAIETDPIGYLVKPYDEDDLKAVLKLALFKLRTHTTTSYRNESERIVLGDGYAFNMVDEKLFYNDTHITLGLKELQLLKLLIANRGNVVSFITIESEIWAGQDVSGSAVRTLIYRLRGKLEYKFIKSDYDYGIRLERMY